MLLLDGNQGSSEQDQRGSGDPDSGGRDFELIVVISACSCVSHGDVAKLLEDKGGARLVDD